EWYNMANGYQPGAQETFQVILHDPAFYSTSLGDGPIKIQYNTFNNVDSGATVYNHGVYSTIGIENQTQQIGLEYSFNNTYPTAASPLGNNRAIYITNIPVYYDQAFLVLGETVVMDTNNNNIVEPGESVELGIQLLNIGNGEAENISAVLSTTDPMVTISNNTSSYHTISGDGTGFNLTAFTFTVSENCQPEHNIPFMLDITTPTDTWQRSFNIVVKSSELDFVSFFINDIAGNNNGIADADEDFLIIVNAKNNSDVVAINLMAVLATTNPLVTIQNPVQIIPQLEPGDIIQYVYDVHFGAIAANTYVPFTFNVLADNAAEDTALFTVACGSSGVNLDFENDNGNLISQSGWMWGTPTQTTAHSGVKVWATNLSGEYPSNADFSLKTEPIFVGANASLSFWHLLGCESGWDGGNVAVSNNGGTTWNILYPTSGGTYINNITALGEPGFSAGPTSWTLVTFNLNQFANSEIVIRWRFGSDSIINGIGWFIDDVTITGYSIKTGILSGTVTLSDAANPAFAKVSTQNKLTANPDSTGVYQLYLPVGSYTATASLQYYEGMTSPSFVISDQNLTHSQDFVLFYLPAPSGLTVTAEPEQSTVNLSWIAPEEPFYPVQAYKVYRRLGPGNYSLVGQISNTFFEDNLTLEGHYYYYVCAVYTAGEGAPSEVAELDFPVVSNPDEHIEVLVNRLDSNYPNPFNPTTTIAYSLAKRGKVNLKIYNTKGQLVKTLIDDMQPEGRHSVVWNGLDSNGKAAASGMYLYRMSTDGYSSVRKMMLLK
ncbi:MAG: FlgD immunoglobulin-like domain containing protein, partial [Candidatus Cloacimonadaceae bacterium]